MKKIKCHPGVYLLVFLMAKIELMRDIYWVGAVDWNLRHFHGFSYSIHRGTTYNSYLIVDDKVALVDCVYHPFSEEMLERISEIIDPAKIDYIIANHLEPDHSSGILDLLEAAPKAKVFGTARCKMGLEKYYAYNGNFNVVKTGDRLSLGRRTLTFMEAPMIHWPDSMFTYIAEDELLMPNDAFGQHLATSSRFNDQVDRCELIEEAKKYYANIIWPLSPIVLRKLEEIRGMGLKIKMIAPSHGVVWRENPGEIVGLYYKWAKGEKAKKVIIAYDTMWGSTEKMAKAIMEGAASVGAAVKLFRLPDSDESDIFGDLLDAGGLIIGSSTINNGMLPTLGTFAVDLKGLKPRGKMAAVFGSYGWGGGAAKELEAVLADAGCVLAMPSLTVNWAPSKEELERCVEFGRDFANKL
jgi:anaerobic nitric oxide reductase flavorubredoxin